MMDDAWSRGWMTGARALVMRVDPRGLLLGANPAACEVLGASLDALVGRSWFDLLPERLAARAREELAGWLGGAAGPLALFQAPVRGAAGQLHGVAWSLCALQGSGGALLIGEPLPVDQAQDGWESPGAAHTLLRRRAADLLDSIIENVPTMLFLKEARELRFVRFNKAGEELLGWPRSKLIGRDDRDFFPEEEARFFIAKDREVLAGDVALDIPEEPIHTSHGLRWLHTRKIPLKDERGQPLYLLGISEDITEKRAAANALEKLTRELARSNEDLEQFAYAASHDLQEPLRMMRSFADLLARRYRGRLDAEADEFLDYITGGARRMQALIVGLLSWARVGSQGQPLAPTDCNALLQTVVLDLQLAIEEAGATVTVAPLPTIRGDASQLGQLFTNLIGNALKFRRRDTASVVRVSAREVDGEWQFSVRDNGIGVPPEHRERIFGIFQRLHEATEYPGNGLGLAICKRIVERHGGRIWLELPPEGGSEFRFSVPRD